MATFHAVLAGYEVDFAVDDSPLIECIGWAIHSTDHNEFQFDTVRAARTCSQRVTSSSR